MTKYTQKQLKEMVANGMAIDVSNISFEKAQELRKEEKGVGQIGYASGVYGCSGMLLRGNKTGQLYAVVGRTQAIYLF